MTGLVLPVDPIIREIGPLILRWYGLMIGLGIVAGCYIGAKEAERHGVSMDDAINLATWAIPVAFIFARLFHVLDELPHYIASPMTTIHLFGSTIPFPSALAINEGGLAIYGGLIGGVLGGAAYAKRHHLPVGKLADAAAPGMLAGQAIGRIGCFFNGDHQGLPTNLPWGTQYTNNNTVVPDWGVPRHPTQIYEGLFDLVVFGIIWALRKRIATDGVLFWLYASLYSFGRFWISFLRLDTNLVFGLKEAQIVSLVTFMIGVPIILYLLGRSQRTPSMPPSSAATAA